MFRSLLRTFTGSETFWKKMMIWMHFGDKMRGSSKLTFELVRGRQSESTILSIISCKRIVILSYFLRVMLVFVRGVGAVCVYDQPGDEATLVKQMVSDRSKLGVYG